MNPLTFIRWFLRSVFDRPHFEVFIEGSASGRYQRFWTYRKALEYFRQCPIDLALRITLQDAWQSPPALLTWKKCKKPGPAQYRHGLPNPETNAYGTVLSPEGLPIICGHGGSAWLCPCCALEYEGKKDMGEDTETRDDLSQDNDDGVGQVLTASRPLTAAEYVVLRPAIERARKAGERKTLVKEKQEIYECHVGFYCPGTLEWVQEWVQGQAQVPAENATQALHRMRMFAVRLGTIKLDSLKNLNASSS